MIFLTGIYGNRPGPPLPTHLTSSNYYYTTLLTDTNLSKYHEAHCNIPTAWKRMNNGNIYIPHWSYQTFCLIHRSATTALKSKGINVCWAVFWPTCCITIVRAAPQQTLLPQYITASAVTMSVFTLITPAYAVTIDNKCACVLLYVQQCWLRSNSLTRLAQDAYILPHQHASRYCGRWSVLPWILAKCRTVLLTRPATELIINYIVQFMHEMASTILMILQLLAILVLNIYTSPLLKYKLQHMLIK